MQLSFFDVRVLESQAVRDALAVSLGNWPSCVLFPVSAEAQTSLQSLVWLSLSITIHLLLCLAGLACNTDIDAEIRDPSFVKGDHNACFLE